MAITASEDESTIEASNSQFCSASLNRVRSRENSAKRRSSPGGAGSGTKRDSSRRRRPVSLAITHSNLAGSPRRIASVT